MLTTFTKDNVKLYIIEGMIKPLPATLLKSFCVFEGIMGFWLLVWGAADFCVTMHNKKKGVKKA
jgi:hypothetical protein